MKVLSRTVGVVAWVASGWHMLWANYHDGRASVHAKRKAVHEGRRDARIDEASLIEGTAATLAPRKPKVEALPPPPPAPVQIERKALAVAVQNFHPSRREEDA